MFAQIMTGLRHKMRCTTQCDLIALSLLLQPIAPRLPELHEIECSGARECLIQQTRLDHIRRTIHAPVISAHRDEFWSLIEGPVDLLFCNLEEARSLTGKQDPIECATEIHRHAENVALTLGPDGSILMHEGRVIPISGAPAAAIDTTGAGDMYAGALLFGITNGMTWNDAGRLASHAAARIVTQLGARLQRKFTPEEIRGLLG